MIAFITRKFPPAVGGMENFSAGLAKALGADCYVLALKKSQAHLIWWLPITFIRLLWLSPRMTNFHFGDGVLAGLAAGITWLTGKPISITVHGLDLTYNRYGYQKYIWRALHRCDAIIAVSHNTARILTDHGINPDIIAVIPNGIAVADWQGTDDKQALRQHLAKTLAQPLPHNAFLLLTVGRLVRRKGVAWFIEQVMPHLPQQYYYIVVGSGPEESRIQQLITDNHLTNRVFQLGRVDDTILKNLYKAADIFVMPNIEVINDIEGFGIVAIEAGACGLPILAAQLDGMQDIVVDGKTGFLVKSADARAWQEAVLQFSEPGNETGNETNFSPPSQIRQSIVDRFSWSSVVSRYQAVFKSIQ